MLGMVRTMFEGIFGKDFFTKATEILMVNPETTYPGAWKIINNLYDSIFVPIGLGIMFIYFISTFVEKTTHEQFNFEQLFLLCAKLLAAKILMDNGLTIMANLWGWGLWIIKEANLSLAEGNSVRDAAWLALTGEAWDIQNSDIGPLKTFGILCNIIVPYVFSFLLKLFLQVICYTRLIELLVRTMMAPIAFSDFFTEGTRGNAWRFLKGYLAVCLQGLAIYVICVIFQSMMGKVLTSEIRDFPAITLTYLVMGFAAVGGIVKSQQLIKDMVGGA